MLTGFICVVWLAMLILCWSSWELGGQWLDPNPLRPPNVGGPNTGVYRWTGAICFALATGAAFLLGRGV